MPHPLPAQVHEEIFNRVKESFWDFHFFDALVASKLRQALKDSNAVDISSKTTDKVVSRYYDEKAFKTPEKKPFLHQIQLIFKTAYVLLLSYREECQREMWCSTSMLLANYPEFAGEDEQELKWLLEFRNMMKLALMIIPARLNKQVLINIAARLEGSKNEYITGGGQKATVTRRVTIYQREGNVVAEVRPKRDASQLDNSSVSSTKKSSGSSRKRIKKIKDVNISPEEVYQLAKGPEVLFPEISATEISTTEISSTASDNASLRLNDPLTLQCVEDLLSFADGLQFSPMLGEGIDSLSPGFWSRTGGVGISLPDSIGTSFGGIGLNHSLSMSVNPTEKRAQGAGRLTNPANLRRHSTGNTSTAIATMNSTMNGIASTARHPMPSASIPATAAPSSDPMTMNKFFSQDFPMMLPLKLARSISWEICSGSIGEDIASFI